MKRCLNHDSLEAEGILLLDRLNTLRRGIDLMTRQQFRNALKRSIGADKDYADGCWIAFVNYPLGYLTTRNPSRQAVELIRVALKLAKGHVYDAKH
ncbi:MAG TPA: hypothetical protein VGL77_19815 [Armatimonadota bacterium]|jgi:hypothetical protein